MIVLKGSIMLQEAELLNRLCRSTVYQDFQRSFCEVTQFPLRLSPPENPRLAGNDQVDGQQFSSATDVPVRLGDKIIGLLQLGRPALEARVEHFKTSGKPIRYAREGDFDRIPNAYIDSAGSRSRYGSMVRLLELFANQLAFFANEILIQQAEREPYRVRMARAYISNRQTEDFSLSDVARAVHVSPFYLCKIFKKATGLTFVEFRNRLRIESAMKLLANPNQSVSVIAYSVGFQSLTQFNRLFRRIVGQSPTTFRCSLREVSIPPKPNRNGAAVTVDSELFPDESRGSGANARTIMPRSLYSISSCADLPQSFPHAGEADVGGRLLDCLGADRK
jgi:AraC-like DNA-binding protein